MKKKYIIIAVVLLIGAIALGSSLAWWTWTTSSNEQTNVVVTVGGITINYEDGEDITNNNLIPTSTKEKGISKNITVSSTGQVYLDLNMAVVTLDDGLKDASFKYEIYNGSDLVTGGNFVNSNAGDNIVLLSGVEVTSSPTTYTLYIWIDGNMSNPNTMYNQNFEFRLNAEATDEKPVYATDTITNIYNTATKTQITNNSINYNYATEVGMMEDIGGNIRYYGADPNNYVSFNNELWRIIGVFNEIDDGTGTKETRIKIIRNESIGNYSWDNKPSGTGSSTSQYGSNEWSDSALMNVLNNGAYYNRTTGTCPSGHNGATTTCDFSTTGLTDEAKNMIGNAVWNLGGSSTYQGLYADDYYTFERGTTVYSGRSTTWTGKVALMYPSDYLYTSNLATCSSDGYYWNTSGCADTSWLFISGTYQWTLTPRASSSSSVFYVYLTGYVYDGNVTGTTHASRPVLFLKSNVQITGGDGSQNNPFTLSI